MKLQFRATSPRDAPEVAAFLQRIFDIDPSLPLITPRHLHWKCWEERSDWPGSRGYVLTREDVIVAHGTVVPLSCVNGQQRLKMVNVIDWAADPESVGSGATLMMKIARLADGVLLTGGSEMAQKVVPALGFKACGFKTKFVRPLRPLRRLAKQKPSVRLGAQFARSLLWSLRAPSVRVQGWTARRVAPEQLASQAIRWPRAKEGTTILERTPDMVAYLLKCPVTPIELYSVAKDGSSCGYFLLAHAPGQTRIADFYVDSEDREDWRALIQLAVSEAARNVQAAEVVSLGSDPATHQALVDCGFHDRGKSELRLLAGKSVELRPGPIRFQMIDGDAAYWHENENAYWA